MRHENSEKGKVSIDNLTAEILILICNCSFLRRENIRGNRHERGTRTRKVDTDAAIHVLEIKFFRL